MGVMSDENALARFGNSRSHCALVELKESIAPLIRKKVSKDFFINTRFY
jgi:hypothetical protein